MTDRHQFRADWHDYDEGTIFVTVCCAQKQHLLGKITAMAHNNVGTRFIASELGVIVEEEIQKIPSYYHDVLILNYVVMPNHIHMILSVGIDNAGSRHMREAARTSNLGCLKPPRHDEPTANFHHNSRLASIIGAFKAGVTRQARTRRIASLQDGKIWQSRFHDHIIRDRRGFDNIMNYIDTNVENWCYDCHNENHIDNADAPWRKKPSEPNHDA